MTVNNKGFTLIELLVGMVVSSVVMASVLIMFNMCFTHFRAIQFQSQMQEENQILKENLKEAIQGCSSYNVLNNDDVRIIELKCNDRESGTDKYYNYLIFNNRCYLKITDSKLSIDNIHNAEGFEFLADYILNINITPMNKNKMLRVKIVNICFEQQYESEFVVRLRVEQGKKEAT